VNYRSKLAELKMILDFNHEYFGKDFKSNFKFIALIVSNDEKKHARDITDDWKNNTYNFIETAIKIHKEIYKCA
jgi:hypothetical protein